MKRRDWEDLARKLDWEPSYVSERELFPEHSAGGPWLPRSSWEGWQEPYRTTYSDYVQTQHEKDEAVYAVRDVVGRAEDAARLHAPWLNALKLHAATLPLAEFAAVIGNLRGTRFGRDSAWRMTANFGALDELRHT